MDAQDAPHRLPADLALFLDVDGTLIDFAPRPDQVHVPPDLPQSLAAVQARLGGALALVSGRSIAELDQLMAPLRLCASGLHGAEIRAVAGGPATRATPLPPSVAEQLRHALVAFPGVALEDKQATLAVHYRAAPDLAGSLHQALLRFASSLPENALAVACGELVFELKPPGFDKGRAVSDFMRQQPFAGRTPVFISDHEIDAAGFAAATAMGGFGLAVGSRLPGTAGWFANPAALRAWLKELE